MPLEASPSREWHYLRKLIGFTEIKTQSFYVNDVGFESSFVRSFQHLTAIRSGENLGIVTPLLWQPKYTGQPLFYNLHEAAHKTRAELWRKGNGAQIPTRPHSAPTPQATSGKWMCSLSRHQLQHFRITENDTNGYTQQFDSSQTVRQESCRFFFLIS